MEKSRPFLTHLLIIANILVFIYQAMVMDQAMMEQWVLTHQHIIVEQRYETFFTSAFMHGGPVHLVMNMIFLYLLGKQCEDVYGTLVTAVIYVTAIVTGGLSFIYLFPEEMAVGASAAIFGLAGAAMLGMPERSLLHRVPLLRILDIPIIRNFTSAIFVSSLFLVLPNLLNMFNVEGGVAHIAHVGGLAAGAVFALIVRSQKAWKGIWLFLIFIAFAGVIMINPSETVRQYAIIGILVTAALTRPLLSLL